MPTRREIAAYARQKRISDAGIMLEDRFRNNEKVDLHDLSHTIIDIVRRDRYAAIAVTRRTDIAQNPIYCPGIMQMYIMPDGIAMETGGMQLGVFVINEIRGMAEEATKNPSLLELTNPMGIPFVSFVSRKLDEDLENYEKTRKLGKVGVVTGAGLFLSTLFAPSQTAGDILYLISVGVLVPTLAFVFTLNVKLSRLRKAFENLRNFHLAKGKEKESTGDETGGEQ